MSEYLYRVTGTDKDGQQVTVTKASRASALASAEEANRQAAKAERPQDWVAEQTAIEWTPIPPPDKTNQP